VCSAGPVATAGTLDSVVRRRHGQPLSLRCQFHGVPTPQVEWLKNGKPVSSQRHSYRFHVSTVHHSSEHASAPADDDDDDDDLSMVTSDLQVDQSSVSDSGMYQCRASNTVGVAVVTTWVDVLTTGSQTHLLPLLSLFRRRYRYACTIVVCAGHARPGPKIK